MYVSGHKTILMDPTFARTEAVHRYYESRRRLFNDERPGRKERATAARLKCKRAHYQKKVPPGLKMYFNMSCSSSTVLLHE